MISKTIMHENDLKVIASFMIALIVCIPLYSSSVLAEPGLRQGTKNGQIYGSDNIPGIYNQDGSITIEITARFPDGGVVEPSNVLVSDSNIADLSGVPFDSCTPLDDGWYRCIKPMSIDPTEDEKTFYIRLYSDTTNANSIVPRTTRLTGYYDTIEPTVVSVDANPSEGNAGQVTLEYLVYDRANIGTDDKCSGLNKLELYSDDKEGVIIKSIPLNTEAHDCNRSNPIQEDYILGPELIVDVDEIIDTTNSNEREVLLTLRVYDNLDYYGEKTTQFSYDAAGPSVDSSSLEIKDTDNLEITYISESPIEVSISFLVTSSDLDTNSVYGDLSNINTDSPAGYDNIQASCTPIAGENFRCTFPNVDLKIAPNADVNIPIRLADSSGNANTATLIKDIAYDNIGPDVRSIKTDKFDETYNYLGDRRNRISLELLEEGIGIDKKQIYINLEEIGLNNRKQADICQEEESNWFCYWNNIIPNVNDGEYGITIITESYDDLDNSITFNAGITEADVIVDKTDPIINGNIRYETDAELCPTSNNVITFTLDVTENYFETNKVTITADTSIISETATITQDCTNNNPPTGWECSIQLGNLKSTPVRGNVDFTISDISGNTAQDSISIEICGIDGTAPPDIDVTTGNSIPSQIDKRTLTQASLVTLPVYIPLTINTNGATIEFTSPDCSGTERLSPLDNVYLLNDETTSPTLVLSVIGPVDETSTTLDINCIIPINIRDNNNVYSQPQDLTISKSIPLFNNPLGSMSENVQKELDDIEAEIQDAQDKIEENEGLIDTFASICGVVKTMQNLKKTMETLRSGTFTTMTALYYVGVGVSCGNNELTGCNCQGPPAAALCPAGIKLKNLANNVWKSVCKVVQTISDLVDNIWGLLGDFLTNIFQWGCAVFYDCALCDFDTWVSFTLSVTGARDAIGNTVGSTYEENTLVGGWFKDFDDWTRDKTFDSEFASSIPSSDLTGGVITDTISSISTSLGGGEWGDGAPNSLWDTNGHALNTEFIDDGDIFTATTEEESSGGGSWVMNPYKSQHYALWCACIPAIKYNQMKDKQIKCMKKNCIEDMAMKGLSTKQCYTAYAERECLYVEGAGYKLHGINIFSSIVELIKENLSPLLIGIAQWAICGNEFSGKECKAITAEYTAQNTKQVACGVTGAIELITGYEDMWNSIWSINVYDPPELDPDFCETGEY